MKIVYIANARIPTEKAHGLQIMKMCEAFALQGNDVELIIPCRWNKIKKDPFVFYGVNKNFKIKKLWSLDLLPLRIGEIGLFFQVYSFLFCCWFYLKNKKGFILYTREKYTALFFKGYILEFHDKPKRPREIFSKIWSNPKLIINTNQFIKKEFLKYRSQEKNILVAPNGVNLEEFMNGLTKDQARKKLKIPLGKKIIGYIGMLKTMGMEKGVGDAIKSLVKLSNDSILFLVGGSKQDIHYYQELSKKNNVQDRVCFVGNVDHSKVPIYLKAFDLIIAPFPRNEHYLYFMSPLKIFEYMASQRPIIATDLPSIREVLNDKNSFLIEPDNIQALAQSINYVLKNEKNAKQKADKAFQDIKAYTWQARAKKILSFIKSK